MTTRSKPARKESRYLELIRRFELRPLRTEEDLDRATEVVHALVDRLDRLDQDEHDYLNVLSDLVHAYESRTRPVQQHRTDAGLLAFLIESKGVTQSEVAAQTGIAVSTINEVLKGKRKLTRGHVRKLAQFFQVDPGVFTQNGDG